MTEETEERLEAASRQAFSSQYFEFFAFKNFCVICIHSKCIPFQAQIKLSQIGMKAGPKPLKRKVKPGATPSCVRISESGSPEPQDRESFFHTFAATMKKRDYANYLVSKRCDELESRHRARIHEIYREYAVNG